MVRLLIFAVFVGCCAAGNVQYTNNYNVRPQTRYVQNYQTYSNPINTRTVQTYNSPSYTSAPQRVTYRVTPNVRTTSAQTGNNFEIVKAVEYNPFATTRNTAQQHVAHTHVGRPEEQTETFIYLLSKQPDIADLVKRFRDIQVSAVRQPEVRFVKYRNPEDLQRIQESIKSQYENPALANSINGLGAAISEQIATPISNYARSVSATNDDDDLYTARQPPFVPSGVDVVPGSSYLPPRRLN